MSQQIYQFGASRAETNKYQLVLHSCNVYRVDGYCTGATGSNCWLQLFDLADDTGPTTNLVPKKSLFLNEVNGFSYTFLQEDIVGFVNGLWIALSKDETKYVAVTDGSKVSGDFTIEDLTPIAGTTQVGDLTSAVDALEVWAEAAGPKQLVAIDIINNNGVDNYVMIFGKDGSAHAINDGDTPLIELPQTLVSSATAIRRFFFGNDGVWIRQFLTSASLLQGCAIYLSDQKQTLHAAGSTAAIRAFYK